MIALGILAALYIIYPSFGIFEIIPDNLPLIGNIDEAAATTLLIAVLGYFGIDVGNFFHKKDIQQKQKYLK